VRALFNHNPDRVLGRSASRTLKLAEDSVELAVEIEPPKSEAALVELMVRGDVSQMSFGFIVRGEEWEERDEYDLRTVTDVDLFAVSVVTYPAYPQTDAAVRSLERWKACRSEPAVMKLYRMRLQLEREYAAARQLKW
jgi:HK97 family phage prohead protease